MEKRKRTKNSAVHPPRHPAYTKIPARQLTNDIAATRATCTVGIMQPVALLTHPFDTCIKAARNTGFAEGHASRALEVRELMVKLQSFERHIAQLEGWLRGSEILGAAKMEGDFHHRQGTTNGASSAPTTVDKTVVATAHVFHEFVPGAPFHSPILHPTIALPADSVIRANALLKHNEHQPPSKSSDPWGSLALRHIRRTRQQNHSFCKSIYTIPAHRSTFALIVSALSLARSIPSWVLSRFTSVGSLRLGRRGRRHVGWVDL
jgi:hypothetical protein